MTRTKPQPPPPDKPNALNWSLDTDETKAKEIARLAELQLEDVIGIATSSDSRAVTLGTGMSAVSAGLLAGAVAINDLSSQDNQGATALIASSVFFMVAAGVAIWSARPVIF